MFPSLLGAEQGSHERPTLGRVPLAGHLVLGHFITHEIHLLCDVFLSMPWDKANAVYTSSEFPME